MICDLDTGFFTPFDTPSFATSARLCTCLGLHTLEGLMLLRKFLFVPVEYVLGLLCLVRQPATPDWHCC